MKKGNADARAEPDSFWKYLKAQSKGSRLQCAAYEGLAADSFPANRPVFKSSKV